MHDISPANEFGFPAHELEAEAVVVREEPGRLATAEAALHFMMAGEATVTFRGRRDRFTYKLTASEDGAVTFVSTLVGPDNWTNYKYLGYIRRGVYFHGGRKAKIGADAMSAKAFDWTFRALTRGLVPDGLEVWHEGRCGRCGRKLTVPESIASGFGPECINHV